MADHLTKEQRSENMRRIKSKDTKPELLVRRIVHGLGYRYRLHRKHLPGRPDLTFGPRRKVIFVNGCFWHGHDSVECPHRRTVKTNSVYWGPKITRNRERDAANLAALKSMGWDALTIWECEIRDRDALVNRLRAFLDGNDNS